MNIVVDAYGGDNAPLAVLEGAAQAVSELGVHITLVGDRKALAECAKEHRISLKNMSVIDCSSVIDIHEEPTEILKSRRDCTMAKGLDALAEGNHIVKILTNLCICRTIRSLFSWIYE